MMTNEEKALLKQQAEAAEHMRTLDAMERIVLKLGGRREYSAWLNVYPEDAELTGSGGVHREAKQALAADPEAPAPAEKAFASIMHPTLPEHVKENGGPTWSPHTHIRTGSTPARASAPQCFWMLSANTKPLWSLSARWRPATISQPTTEPSPARCCLRRAL